MKFVKCLLVSAVVMASLSLGGQIAPAGAQSVGEPQQVPGLLPAETNWRLRSVSCGSETECVALGDSAVDAGETPALAVVRISGGRILPAKLYPGLKAADISCPTARDCIIIGSKVRTIRDGKVGPSQPVPGSQSQVLGSVSCWSASDCVAVGYAFIDGPATQTTGIVVSIKDGVAQPPVAVPGTTALTTVDCRSSTCQSVGGPPRGTFPLGASGAAVVTIVNGVPSVPVLVRGTQGEVFACSSTTTCLLRGDSDIPAANIPIATPGTPPPTGPLPTPTARESATVITVINGQPGAERPVATPWFSLRSMACESATRCVAIGPGAGPRAAIPDEFTVVSFSETEAGQPETHQGGTYYDVACAGSGGCLAVGSTSKSASKFSPSIVSLGFKLGDGTPGAAVTTAPKVEGSSVSLGISCTASAGKSCAIKGTLKTRSGGRSVVVAAKNASVKDGDTATLKLTLNAKGKKLFAKSAQLAVTLAVTSTTGGKTKTVVTRKLTLRK